MVELKNSRIATMIDQTLSLSQEETVHELYKEFQNSLNNKQDIFKRRQCDVNEGMKDGEINEEEKKCITSGIRLEEVHKENPYSNDEKESHTGKQLLEGRHNAEIDDKANKENMAPQTAESKRARKTRRHISKTNFQCVICKSEFLYKSKLRRHLLTHSVKRSNACEYCGKTYVQPESKNRHCRVKHNC